MYNYFLLVLHLMNCLPNDLTRGHTYGIDYYGGYVEPTAPEIWTAKNQVICEGHYIWHR